MRTIGGAIGSAIVITILASETATHRTPAGAAVLATESAYQLAFLGVLRLRWLRRWPPSASGAI